jgi:hypothetical protein
LIKYPSIRSSAKYSVPSSSLNLAIFIMSSGPFLSVFIQG